MAYATLDGVKEQDPRAVYNDTSSPSAAQVEQLLEDVAGEIDTVLSAAGYTVPITAPATLLAAVTRLNALGAAAMAHMGMFPEAVGAGPTSDLGSRLWTMYTDGLERLVEAGKAGASGTTGAAVSARSYQVDNPTDTAAAQSLFPRAKVF
jgi:hypothetical protein